MAKSSIRRAALLLPLGAIASLFSSTEALAEASYDAANKMFRLDGGEVTYAFKINAAGILQSVYWGKRLPDRAPLAAPELSGMSGFDVTANVVPQEYAGQGGGLYSEPALKVTWPDGNRDLVLYYRSHQVSGDEIRVTLSDLDRPLFVTLIYRIDRATGVIARSSVVENRGATDVRVDQAAGAGVTLPVAYDYRLHYSTGRWAAEWTLQDRPLRAGATVLESRRGSTGSQNNPWFQITRATTTEESGPAWIGALAWSGSWRMSFDQDVTGRIRIVGGFNPFDFAYRLRPGETLDTPTFYIGYSDEGRGGASRLFHRFERERILPRRGGKLPLRPVLYNSWEATEFKVNEAEQMALAEKAASLGVERFVMDDGWFGARNNDKAGLGDWQVNPTKFPNGLKPLIDKVKSLKMDFGLWVEPEMVNADSDLFRAHPDWAMQFKGRPRTEGRNQLVLNLARTDVRDHLLKVLDDLLTQNDIAFLKWDYNRNWSEPGWPDAEVGEQQNIYVAYVRNLYWIIDELRKRHPNVEIESCSGGGGRVDLGIMARTDEMWPSDNTDPYDRLLIQDGYTQAYAPATMMAWVTDSPNWVNGRQTTLPFRFLSAMQGGLGIGTNLNKWQATDFALGKYYVASYKRIRETVQQGQLYRLNRESDADPRWTNLYVAPDKSQAALFTLVGSTHKLDVMPTIALTGLDPDAYYRIETMEGTPLPATIPARATGAYWMNHGVDVTLRGDFVGVGFILTRG
ncbi:alpha-galactosidase [Sphingomonas jinjuensis]|uniref:Alpha-galactosidase n=1 Tax=Sphingomonas jinjuensis TaxID=535907 RepID=A0A840F7K5_9SPHN|nr:alpha-galactosidase [Sphingomonas jinjuensis]MBB4153930.1 alpha-galactosidase [Sphingomonas jinjuensis]